MSEAECWQLLRSTSIGRLAVSHQALPAIVPVQYYTDDRRLTICLGHNDLPTRSIDHSVVAFSADSIKPRARTGWAVEMKGFIHVAEVPGHIDTECGKPTQAQIVHLDPVTIVGRWIELCPFIAEGT